MEDRIRGWLPKDSVTLYLRKMSKPIWWRPLWIAVVILTLASGILAFFALHMPLQQVVIGTVFAFICIGIAYYIRVKPSFRINRALYVLLGITPFGFVISVAYAVFLGRYVTGWLMGWFNIIVIIGILITGAFIGDRIGKRRNYQLPLSI
ncbi:MAG: hypothetical protein WCD81_02840 [Candidatus Bathyarchaeia archaeon]